MHMYLVIYSIGLESPAVIDKTPESDSEHKIIILDFKYDFPRVPFERFILHL